MRVLLAIVVALAVGWSGWWWWHAAMRERAVEGWLVERRTAGWVAEAGTVGITGFPNRLDLIVQDLALGDPLANWSWTAPEFQVLSLTYQPHHVIAVWPGTQTVASPFETVEVVSARMRGSVVFVPRPGLALDRSTIEIDDMRLEGRSGWSATLAKAVLATRRSDGDDAQPFAYDIAFDAEALQLPAGWTGAVDRSGLLPAAMERAIVDATLAFDRPWDRDAVEGPMPVLEAVEIRDLRMNWGSLDLRGRGAVVADDQGYARGTIDFRARNWREMLDIAVGTGMIGRNVAGAVETGLGLLARLSPDRNSIDVPLTFENGRTRLGPIGMGAAPRLAQRP